MSSSDDKLHVCCYFGPDRCRHARQRSQPASWRRFPPPHAHRARSSPPLTPQPCAKIPVTASPVPPWGASPIPWGARLSSGLHGAASVLCTGDVFAPVFVSPSPPPAPSRAPAASDQNRKAAALSTWNPLLGLPVRLLGPDSLPAAKTQPQQHGDASGGAKPPPIPPTNPSEASPL